MVLTPAERKARLKEEARKAKEMRKKKAAARKKKLLQEIAAKRQAKATAKLLAQKEREEARLAARRLKAESKLRARQARAARRGKPIPVDSAALRELERQLARSQAERDSLFRLLYDEWVIDSAAMFAPADTLDSLPPAHDSIYRLLKGYRNVRIYRSDFQSVCDSMTAISTDSTLHFYIDPVLWNETNQITSEVMDVFTRSQQLERAEFVGSPMMVSRLDSVYYNQIAGKEMTAYFRDNAIWLNSVRRRPTSSTAASVLPSGRRGRRCGIRSSRCSGASRSTAGCSSHSGVGPTAWTRSIRLRSNGCTSWASRWDSPARAARNSETDSRTAGIPPGRTPGALSPAGG